MGLHHTFFVIIFLTTLCFASSKRLQCREKPFHQQNGCFLSKISITSLEDDISFGRTDNKIKALHIENEIVSFLPRSMMEEFSECKILHVVASGLKSVDKSTFEDTKQLEYINLEKNQLTDLFRDTFSELNKLTSLKLDKNKIKAVPSKAFAKNTELQTLSLSFNEIEKIHENTFATLTKLRFLYLSNNKIVELRDPTFATNEALNTLDLSSNLLREVGKSVFEPLGGSLKSLRLDNNTCIADNAIFTNKDKSLNLDELREKLTEECLPFPIKDCQNEKEKLREANESLKAELQSSKGKEMKAKTDAAKKQRELEAEIEKLKKESANKTEEMKSLEVRIERLSDVYDNRTAIIAAKDFAVDKWNICERKLTQLKVNENEAKALEREVQSSFGDEKCFTFEILCEKSDHAICDASGVVVQFENMTMVGPKVDDEVLKISKSFVLFFPSDIFKKFQNLKKLEVDDSNLRQIRRGSFASAGNLVHLDISKNPLTELPDASFEGAEKLEILILAMNKIENISPKAFKGLHLLEKLSLNRNKLTEILAGTFDDLPSLKFLHLSGNKFHHLGGDILKLNTKLEVLIINENPELRSIGENIVDNCPNIREIYYGLIGCVENRIKPDDTAAFKSHIKQKCNV